MTEHAKDPNELGALWIKTSARGEFMTGSINGEAVVVFKNDRKVAGSNQPDWRVLKAKPKDDDPRLQRYKNAPRLDAPADVPAAAAATPNDTQDDIPF